MSERTYSVTERRWIPPAEPSTKSPEKTAERAFGNIIRNKRNRFGETDFGNLVQTNSRYEIFIEGLFQPALHGTEPKNPAFLSRHKVLHGEDIGYGTLKNALKLFLILDYLSDFEVSNLTDPDDSKLLEFRPLSTFQTDRKG